MSRPSVVRPRFVRPIGALALLLAAVVTLSAFAVGSGAGLGGRAAPLGAPTADAAAPTYPPLTGNLTGPTVVATATSSTYFVNATGGPAYVKGLLVGNLTFAVTLTGANLTGVTVTPQNGSMFNNTPSHFVLKTTNVTQTLTITVLLKSALANVSRELNLTLAVPVVVPYVISTELVASTNATVLPFSITVDLDGQPIATVRVPEIPAGQSYAFRYLYATTGLSVGYHTFSISLAQEHGLVRFPNGATTYSMTVYVAGPPPNYTIWIVAGVIAFFAAAFISLARLRARRRRRR